MDFKVFGIGEVLWDLLPWGHQLGGAPANFTYHAHSLGCATSLITRIGNDFLGQRILQEFSQRQLSRSLIQIDEHYPTGTVGVTFPSHGTPQYAIHENVAWDYLKATQQAISAIAQADAICFGSLSQRSPVSRATIFTLLQAAPKNAFIVFDINLRQAYYTHAEIEASFQLANVLKLNHEEMDILAEIFKIPGSLEKKMMWLAKNYGFHTIALTRGSEGSILFHQGSWSNEPARKIDIADTIGAGDSFTAALVAGLLHGLEPDKAHEIAAEVSSYVCSQVGGMPLLPTAFRTRILELR